ncbi:hypothetical protein [Magnetospirillum sulfuroxidans]|uniref:Uncharacterized protein n=1 Tax=Magnetospirillum sulfuroxidans TaxID=611300 RepID=A0ABS5IBJ7_9PROT|nr:hypothetical protein [Magnetospirillum sulfuroxidans]MBR9971801.1 hypothetical protein [Magnetospirillum sulfuroxidans]
MDIAETVKLIHNNDPRSLHVLRDALLPLPYQLADVFVCRDRSSFDIRWYQVKDTKGSIKHFGRLHKDSQCNRITPGTPPWTLMYREGVFEVLDVWDRNHILGGSDDYLAKQDNAYALLERAYPEIFMRDRLHRRLVHGLKDLSLFRIRRTIEEREYTICFRFFNRIDDTRGDAARDEATRGEAAEKTIAPDITERALALQETVLSSIPHFLSWPTSQEFSGLKARCGFIQRNIRFLSYVGNPNCIWLSGPDPLEREFWARAIHNHMATRGTDAPRDPIVSPPDPVPFFGDPGSTYLKFSGNDPEMLRGTHLDRALSDPKMATIYVDDFDRAPAPALLALLDAAVGQPVRKIDGTFIDPNRLTIILGSGPQATVTLTQNIDQDQHLYIASRKFYLPKFQERSEEGVLDAVDNAFTWAKAKVGVTVPDLALDDTWRKDLAQALLSREAPAVSMRDVVRQLMDALKHLPSDTTVLRRPRTPIPPGLPNPRSEEEIIWDFIQLMMKRFEEIKANGNGAASIRGPMSKQADLASVMIMKEMRRRGDNEKIISTTLGVDIVTVRTKLNM